jgi:putative hydrolase of the HAD superfamily
MDERRRGTTTVSHLIWDFDDTLGYRAEGKWTASLVKVLESELPGFPFGVEAIRPHMQSGFPWHAPDRPHTEITSADAWWEGLSPLFAKTFRSIGVPAGEADRLACCVRRVYAEPSAWRLFEDTQPTLRELRELGWTHCMLSNHVPELPVILSHLGILDEFAVVGNSADTGYEKPNPEAFRGVLNALGEARPVWMIGDSYESDIAGAEAMGIPGILVRRDDPRAERRCEDVAGVVALLEGIDD